MDRCQVAAAISRSSGVSVTCASFSASANVAADTGGPLTGPVPNVGGAPAVGDDDGGAADCESGRHAAAAASAVNGAVIRNCRRVFMARSS